MALSIRLEKIDAVLNLLAAKANNEPLWLIRTDSVVNRENVIAWDYDRTTANLILYPANIKNPFVLDLEIQINLNKPESIDTNLEYILKSDAVLERGIFECSQGSRRNSISFK